MVQSLCLTIAGVPLTLLEVFMRRHKMSRGHSRKMFSHTAGNQRVHPKNHSPTMPMRGGIRL